MPSSQAILQPFLEHPALRGALAASHTGSLVMLAGLTRTAKALAAAALAHQSAGPVVMLTRDDESADELRPAIATFLAWLERKGSARRAEGDADAAEERPPVALLPAFDCGPYEGRSPHAKILERRAVTLWNVAQGRVRVLLVPIEAALGRFQPRAYYGSLALDLKTGDDVLIADLAEHLARVGYQVSEPVDEPGLVSVRGGIVDVWPPESPWPLRLEFFGDEIESIREFDPTTQRSRRQVTRAPLLPLVESARTPEAFQALVGVLAERERGRQRGTEPPWAAEYSAPFPGWEFFAPLVEKRPLTVFSLFGTSPSEARTGAAPLLVWDEPRELRKRVRESLAAWAEAFDEVRDMTPGRPQPELMALTEEEFWRAAAGLASVGLEELGVTYEPPPQPSAPAAPEADQETEPAHTVEAAPLPEHEPFPLAVAAELSMTSQPGSKYRGAVKTWIEDLEKHRARGDSIAVVVPATGRMERLREILQEYEVPHSAVEKATAPLPGGAAAVAAPAPAVTLVVGEIAEGVYFPEGRLLLVAESDVFEGSPFAAGRHEKTAASAFISDLRDLHVGDYVVHIDHGVGRYDGLKQIDVGGALRDFMLLTYQDEARLYVPLERLDLIEKYRAGSEGAKPPLDRLGSGAWARTKARVKKALRDMAEELLKLYAERKMSGGVAYSPDTPWQKEFEDGFEFEETPDQLTALREIKRDLESPQPMDRLLCGDVGYGKTELAMRAAFKVVQDGKQVAVLAPTTVLAFQHYSTFRRRMASFPLRIEMLSRFRSPAEQKATAAEAAAGRVDILIGTHRLLSKDVAFRDLGLLIVDEEQRFGVAAKEKLKKLRAHVDVLTLSATPIPRTLHMSLGGLRDLSVIETPPRGRLAIQTVVAPYGDGLIQKAILQELEREGQVYFVHNRVESIFHMAAIVQRLVPTARIGVGHGQMPEKELERVMLKFIEHGYDVLVSTAIIENGLDIPRANTLIVNHADRFGLADLYQLRGRVGRSDRPAYAFLLIPSEDALTPLARRRLAALKEFSDLGAGFRLAALDLELRGAGNLLGAEQSGHLNSIGLDLYLKMLEQAVEELKGGPPKPEVRTSINLGLDIKIPDAYISDEMQRLRMYKRISSLASQGERAELEAELADRYGPLPPPVSTLLDYALLKSVAEPLGVQSIERKLDDVWLRFHPQAPIDPGKLTRFVHEQRGASLRPDGTLRFQLAAAGSEVIARLEGVLQALRASQ